MSHFPRFHFRPRTLVIAVLLIGSGLAAEDAPRRAETAIIERFKLLDRDGDGTLSPSEFGGTSIWKDMDLDGDGVISADEYRRYYLGPGAAPKANAPVRPAGGSSLANLRFSVDYHPGTRDKNGEYMGGTEVMRLMAHKGKLFASLGYWTDKPEGDPHPSAQILRKDSANGEWVVDVSFGERYLRTEGMMSFEFTTDSAARKLAEPVSLLLSGPSDTQRTEDRETTVWVRDDERGTWAKCGLAAKLGGVRSFGSHVDVTTHAHSVFAGTSRGDIFRGAYDPSVPGLIKWQPKAEHSGTGRVMCFAECNGALYAACGVKSDKPDGGGLYRRSDGENPDWKLVYRWPYVDEKKGDEWRILRGLTAVRDQDGHQFLLATRTFPGVVERIDPSNDHKASIDFDILGHFTSLWGHYRGPVLSAYNVMTPAVDPAGGEKVLLIGVWVEHPKHREPPFNGSYYLVRHADGKYGWGNIYDPDHPIEAGKGLSGTRTIEVSPFPEEKGRVFYFGGHDCASRDSHNTAWIYRGTVPGEQKR